MGEQHANGCGVSRHRLVADATSEFRNPMRAVTSGGLSRARPCSPTPEASHGGPADG